MPSPAGEGGPLAVDEVSGAKRGARVVVCTNLFRAVGDDVPTSRNGNAVYKRTAHPYDHEGGYVRTTVVALYFVRNTSSVTYR